MRWNTAAAAHGLDSQSYCAQLTHLQPSRTDCVCSLNSFYRRLVCISVRCRVRRVKERCSGRRQTRSHLEVLDIDDTRKVYRIERVRAATGVFPRVKVAVV